MAIEGELSGELSGELGCTLNCELSCELGCELGSQTLSVREFDSVAESLVSLRSELSSLYPSMSSNGSRSSGSAPNSFWPSTSG